MTSLTKALSVDTFAFFRAPTLAPTHVISANFARLDISSPVSKRTNPYTRSSAAKDKREKEKRKKRKKKEKEKIREIKSVAEEEGKGRERGGVQGGGGCGRVIFWFFSLFSWLLCVRELRNTILPLLFSFFSSFFWGGGGYTGEVGEKLGVVDAGLGQDNFVALVLEHCPHGWRVVIAHIHVRLHHLLLHKQNDDR
jgi:hypothetical protein